MITTPTRGATPWRPAALYSCHYSTSIYPEYCYMYVYNNVYIYIYTWHYASIIYPDSGSDDPMVPLSIIISSSSSRSSSGSRSSSSSSSNNSSSK